MPRISVLLPLLLVLCLSVLPANCNDKPTVRVTTGVVEINGWQDDLVKRNQNLSRWHWNPLYVYKQGLVGGSKNKQATPLPNNTGSSYPSHRQADPSHYLKPAHVPFSPKAMAAVAGRDRPPPPEPPRPNETLSGKIQPSHSEKRTQALLTPSAKTVPKTVLKEPSYPTYDAQNVRSVAAVHGELKETPSLPPAEELRASPKKLPKSHKHQS